MGGGAGRPIGLQGSLMVLATVERANDGYPFRVHGNGIHGLLIGVLDAYA